jgi:glycosyltransferase involved in cell wall biosynthesis
VFEGGSTRGAEKGGLDGRPGGIRVAFVSPEPTPYRSPLLDRVGARGDLDLTVIYAARTVSARTWEVTPRHRAVFLNGMRVPGVQGVFRHEYPLTPGIWGALRDSSPECVVVSGWSTFAAQAALGWCWVAGVPYVLLVESHDAGPKPGWRHAVKRTIVPPLTRGATSVLVVGSLARDSVVSMGASAERVRVFANTIDVAMFAERADRLAARRPLLRAAFGLSVTDVAVLSVGRLAPEKGMATLIQALARARDERLVLLLVGEGPERSRLETLARELAVRVIFAGDRPWESMLDAYVAADAFALLSERETWGVVVNEASAAGLPLVLSERVGAANDLLHAGENGMLVPAGDLGAAAEALRILASDPGLRSRMGVRSREIAAGHGYEASVENLVAAVREAIAGR